MKEFEKALRAIPDLPTIQRTVERASDDPMQANREMLSAYNALSYTFGRLLHGDEDGVPANATFATFAAWSAQSLQADIQSAGDRKDPAKPQPPRRRAARWLYDTTAGAALTDDRAIARNISTGQAAIYQEIGSAFSLMISESLGELGRVAKAKPKARPNWDSVWAKFTEQLVSNLLHRDSDQASGPLDGGDLLRLQNGFKPYLQVLRGGASVPDAEPTEFHDNGTETKLSPADVAARRKERAELILLGNIRLVAYEQARLQPVLDRNLAYLPKAVRVRLGARWSGRDSLLTRHAFDAKSRARRYAGLVDEAFQIAATRYVYSMVIGSEQLRFGVDLPLPPPAHPLLRDDQSKADRDRYAKDYFFPYDLQAIDRPDLWSEWQQYDRSDGQGGRTAVDNWLRYSERLNFIVNLFRSRQQLGALYDPPSSASVSPPARIVPPQPALGPAHVRPAAATSTRLEARFPSHADAKGQKK